VIFKKMVWPNLLFLYVLKCIYQYDLASKLGYFMLDNATNNDTLMQHIQKGMFGFNVKSRVLVVI
jgi:hypothetical protein